MHVVLVRPQIATNTGNIIRLCANVGADLHLVSPLGFSLDASSVKRAGLDYHELAVTTVHQSLATAIAQTASPNAYAFTGHAQRTYTEADFGPDDSFVFGTERSGLDPGDLALFDDAHQLRIPMRPDNRSLNLANAVAIVLYEAWRQRSFHGSAGPRPNNNLAEAPDG